MIGDPTIDPLASPLLGVPGAGNLAPSQPTAVAQLQAAYTGIGGVATGVDIPGTDLTIPTPGEAIDQAKSAASSAVSDAVGQTTQSLFSALLGPATELVMTAVLAGAGVALTVWAFIRFAQSTKTQQEAESVGRNLLGVVK